MPDYYGDFLILESCHYGCNNCGAEYWVVGELRWCLVCQVNIWDEEMTEYRRSCSSLHELNEVIRRAE